MLSAMAHGDFMLSSENQGLLLQLAEQSILSGIENSKPLSISLEQYPQALQKQRATFVTLNIQQQLRGCIGSLSAYRPLVLDVVHNAYAAAFSDPRFPELTKKEFSLLEYHISILSPSSPIKFETYEDLLSQIRPGIDGLILSEGSYRGTFLPSVWDQLNDKDLFMKHLLNKAGLASDYWSKDIEISRYTVESIKPK